MMNKLTPVHTKDWYIKWVASAFIIVALIFTSNNIYPLNLVFHAIGLLGWLLVGMFWVDRSLIVVNAIGLSVILNSLVIYLIDAFKL